MLRPISLREYLETRYKQLQISIQLDYGLIKQSEINAVMAILGFTKSVVTHFMVIKLLLLYPINAIGRRKNEQTAKEVTSKVE